MTAPGPGHTIRARSSSTEHGLEFADLGEARFMMGEGGEQAYPSDGETPVEVTIYAF